MTIEPNHAQKSDDDHNHLPTPALSPIIETIPPKHDLRAPTASSGPEEEPRREAELVVSPSTAIGGSGPGHDAATDNTPSSASTESSRLLKLSPIQIHRLTNSPTSLTLRAIPSQTPPEDISPLPSTLGSPVSGLPPKPLSSPNSDALASAPLTTDASPPKGRKPSGQDAKAETLGSTRPSTTRSLTSPLLKRRESAPGARLPKLPSDGSRPQRPHLTPIKVGDEQRKDVETATKSSFMREGVASPMPPVIPLPPLSLPTYLHLELSSERPSALYIHRPISTEFPYESSALKFERLLNFLRLPHQLEQVLWFGALACLDAWLYTFTILPLRFLKALYLLFLFLTQSLVREVRYVFRYVVTGSQRHWRRSRRSVKTASAADAAATKPAESRSSRKAVAELDGSSDTPRRGRKSSSTSRVRHSARRKPSGLSPYHKADLLHGLLIILSCLLLVRFDASRMYHSIRGQAAIKLYVIYNVLEVCDRLFSALGQDVLECLFSKETLERDANGRSKLIRPIWMFLLALIYNVIHATLLFYQVVTLNVAVNSYSNALLTLLMSNQFVEIKGTVFKKFEKENLFQLTCADVVERFQLWLMLSIIGARNIVEVGGLSLPSVSIRPMAAADTTSPPPPNSTSSSIPSLLPAAFSLLPSLSSPVLTPFLIVLGSEMLVDWLKHAYINKFNSVKPAIYGRFLDVLAKDYYAHAFADQNLTKRLGLPVLPLACLVLRAAAQVWGMLVATAIAPTPPPAAPTTGLSKDAWSPEATAALQRVDAVIRRALGKTTAGGGEGLGRRIRHWGVDDWVACGTTLVFVLLLYLVLLACKLVLGISLLAFARTRYRRMKEREREAYDTLGRRVGGWGVTEVDEDKRRWIYDDDPDGLRRLREREARDRERRQQGGEGEGRGGGGLRLEAVGRYMMAAKRIW